MQAEGVHGKAMAGAVNGCGPKPIVASPDPADAEMLAGCAKGEVSEAGVLALRGIADRLEAEIAWRKREAAEREAQARGEVEDRERDADRLLVVEEMSRVAGLDLKGWLHADLVTLATGQGPDDRLTTPVKNTWWRMLVAAARELRRLRQEVRRHRQFIGVEMAGKPAPQPTNIVVEREWLARLSDGLAVDRGAVFLLPAPDFPRAAVKLALQLDSEGREQVARRLRPVLSQLMPAKALEGDARHSLRLIRALEAIVGELLP